MPPHGGFANTENGVLDFSAAASAGYHNGELETSQNITRTVLILDAFEVKEEHGPIQEKLHEQKTFDWKHDAVTSRRHLGLTIQTMVVLTSASIVKVRIPTMHRGRIRRATNQTGARPLTEWRRSKDECSHRHFEDGEHLLPTSDNLQSRSAGDDDEWWMQNIKSRPTNMLQLTCHPPPSKPAVSGLAQAPPANDVCGDD
jgi:hypothetical protein